MFTANSRCARFSRDWFTLTLAPPSSQEQTGLDHQHLRPVPNSRSKLFQDTQHSRASPPPREAVGITASSLLLFLRLPSSPSLRPSPFFLALPPHRPLAKPGKLLPLVSLSQEKKSGTSIQMITELGKPSLCPPLPFAPSLRRSAPHQLVLICLAAVKAPVAPMASL